jgi:CubicO group peptidase (beta-lactamase class C family)
MRLRLIGSIMAFCLLSGLTGVPGHICAAAAGEEKGPGPDRLGLREAVGRIAASYGAGGAAVAVVRGGLPDDTYAYGSISGLPVTADTKFCAASLSKVVMTMAAMRLREEGAVDLDADIGRYWGAPVRNPNYKNVPVTLRDILSHTSSIIARDRAARDGAPVRANLVSGAAFNKSVPGAISSWCYNNYAFAVLGLTLELAARETVNSFSGRTLFRPLGISASFGEGGASDGDAGFPGRSGRDFAGGLRISASDLSKLAAVLANDGVYEDQQVLSPESVALMETVNPKKAPDQPFFQGLPLRLQYSVYGQALLYYHTGSADGVYNLLSYNPVTKNGVVVLTAGALGSKDGYGIYKVCGEISSYIYANDF